MRRRVEAAPEDPGTRRILLCREKPALGPTDAYQETMETHSTLQHSSRYGGSRIVGMPAYNPYH